MSFANNYHKWIVDELMPFLGRNVVEVGAGTGNLSAMLLETDLHHLFAFEPASNLAPVLQAKMQGRGRISVIGDYFRPELVPAEIDSVLYVNVLEHIEDDQAELEKVYHSLNSGGHLLLFVPALQWLFSEADEALGHHRRYYKKNILELIENTGFKVVKIRYFDFIGMIPWYVNFVLLKNSFNTPSVGLYDRLVIPPVRLIERFITPPIGKNILLVARKE